MRSRQFIFSEDGSCTINWRARGESRTSTGSWSTNASDQTLQLIVEGQSYDYNYEQPNRNTLILTPHNKDGVFNILYFKKD